MCHKAEGKAPLLTSFLPSRRAAPIGRARRTDGSFSLDLSVISNSFADPRERDAANEEGREGKGRGKRGHVFVRYFDVRRRSVRCLCERYPHSIFMRATLIPMPCRGRYATFSSFPHYRRANRRPGWLSTTSTPIPLSCRGISSSSTGTTRG